MYGAVVCCSWVSFFPVLAFDPSSNACCANDKSIWAPSSAFFHVSMLLVSPIKVYNFSAFSHFLTLFSQYVNSCSLDKSALVFLLAIIPFEYVSLSIFISNASCCKSNCSNVNLLLLKTEVKSFICWTNFDSSKSSSAISISSVNFSLFLRNSDTCFINFALSSIIFLIFSL